jgi:hypothetical protein
MTTRFVAVLVFLPATVTINIFIVSRHAPDELEVADTKYCLAIFLVFCSDGSRDRLGLAVTSEIVLNWCNQRAHCQRIGMIRWQDGFPLVPDLTGERLDLAVASKVVQDCRNKKPPREKNWIASSLRSSQ